MKIAVYTAIFGDKDKLLVPIDYIETDNIDYFVFTDSHLLNCYPYKTMERSLKFNDFTKNAKYYKILADPILKGYDIHIWHDGNIQMIHSKINELIDLSKNTFLTTFKHPNRNDYYSEAMTCIRVGKDHSLRILKQSLVYFFDGLPAHHGMFSTGIIVKNYSHNAKGLLEFWWKQTEKYSRRDQLSLAYSILKTDSQVKLLEDDIFNNIYSTYHPHNYTHYHEKRKIKLTNTFFLKQVSFKIVKLLRKIKKITQ
jgi:hypothetical protein